MSNRDIDSVPPLFPVSREITQRYSIRELVSKDSIQKYNVISWMLGYKSKFHKYSREHFDAKQPFHANWVKAWDR